MKKLLYLLLAITVACGGDDDSSEPQTFLERFNGTIWQNDNYDPMNLDLTGTVWMVFYYNSDYIVSDIGFESNADNEVELRCFNFSDDYFSIVTNDYNNLTLSANNAFIYINTLENGGKIELGWSDESYTETFSLVNIPNPCN